VHQPLLLINRLFEGIEVIDGKHQGAMYIIAINLVSIFVLAFASASIDQLRNFHELRLDSEAREAGNERAWTSARMAQST
jgi:hypothetical protein